MQNVPGLLIPPTLPVARSTLLEAAAGNLPPAERIAGCDFPLFVQPVGSQDGRDLEKIERADERDAYLRKVGDAEFFVSRFIDYRSRDGLSRKFRVA